MQVFNDPRFPTMIICLAIAIFSITLNGHLRKNMGQALFGFLGLAWALVSITIFLVFGWKVGVLCLAGSYFFSLIASPISGIVAGFLKRELSRK
jgi:hypothetical protein